MKPGSPSKKVIMRVFPICERELGTISLSTLTLKPDGEICGFWEKVSVLMALKPMAWTLVVGTALQFSHP